MIETLRQTVCFHEYEERAVHIDRDLVVERCSKCGDERTKPTPAEAGF